MPVRESGPYGAETVAVRSSCQRIQSCSACRTCSTCCAFCVSVLMRSILPHRIGQPEMGPKSETGVFGAEGSAFLEERDDPVHELVEAARGEMRYEDEAVGRVGRDELDELRGDRLRAADERLPPRRLDDRLPDGQPLGLGQRAPRAATASGSPILTRPWTSPESGSGSISGSGPSGSYEERSRPQTCSRARIAFCGEICWRRISAARSWASASLSPRTKVTPGMIFRSSGCRPYFASRALTSA